MKLNSALPKIEIDPKTYQVFADGEELSCQPVDYVPLDKDISYSDKTRPECIRPFY